MFDDFPTKMFIKNIVEKLRTTSIQTLLHNYYYTSYIILYYVVLQKQNTKYLLF